LEEWLEAIIPHQEAGFARLFFYFSMRIEITFLNWCFLVNPDRNGASLFIDYRLLIIDYCFEILHFVQNDPDCWWGKPFH
jgi:hypothetical protein